jgi:small subunit ribosomal protein S2
MAPFIYGVRNNIHIIDLAQTVPLLYRALEAVVDVVANGGRVLFVGTKRQASEPVAAAAQRSAQYYVNSRWLGGMLTNWKTISNSIARLRELDELLDGEAHGLTKKERLSLTRERDKLENALGGIKEMGGVPNLVFVIDTNKEAIAVSEAKRLGIPVAAILDSNSNPDDITYPIPGNDDAGRAISLYCDLVAKAAIEGISRAQGSMGIDVGEAVEPPAEAAPEPETAMPAAEPQEDGEAAPAFVRPEGEPDDLKKIGGIGPVLERKLNGLGVTRFDQIAGFTAEDVARVDDLLNFKGRVERDDWVGQARQLAGIAD